MSDRLTMLEERVAALERALAERRAAAPRDVPTTDRDNPLKDHPLIWKKPPPEELAAYEARRREELGIADLPPISVQELRQMLIDAGWDPTSNEASREIIARREERG